MLSMKTLRVAILAMGSALLLGPGLAVAQDTHRLDGLAPTDALVYAQETLGTADAKGRRALELPAARDILVAPRRAIAGDGSMYLRIELAGAQFPTNPQLVRYSAPDANGDRTATADANTVGAGNSQLYSGGMDSNSAVFQIGNAVASGGPVGVRIPDGPAAAGTADDLLLTVTSGMVTASITAYDDPDNALDDLGARTTFAGSGGLIRLTSGLTATIKAADTVTASVDHGFLRFLNDAQTAPTGQQRLGWLGLVENTEAIADGGVLSATTGVALTGGEILTTREDPDDSTMTLPVGMVSFNVMGNLDIGAFTIMKETFRMRQVDPACTTDCAMEIHPDDAGNPVPTGMCSGVTAETAPDRGNLLSDPTDAESRLIGEEGERPSGAIVATSGALAPSVYLLCVNVDVMGPETNMYPIPNADYSATAHYTTGRNTLEPAQMAGEGDLASIKRNGASADIAYLTTSEKHNQRLIIVNRGTRPVAITSITFTSEDGTDVELSATAQAAMDAGLLVVPGNSSYVARMDETLVITGDSRRTAASIAFAATPGNLSVATTQVNVSDGSTDTVVYDVN